MPLPSRSLARSAAVVCLALLAAVPAAALYMRNTVHFSASFDVTGAPGGGLQADIGQIAVVAPPTEFVVVPDDKGGGQLKISDQGTAVPATLIGTFKTNFVGQQLDATWTCRASQSNTPIHVRFVDEADSGMIDVSFGGDGSIVVGGTSVMPYEPGVVYAIQLSLSDPLVGPSSWGVSVTALPAGGAVGVATGPLATPPTGQLTLKAVRIERPSGAPAGQFLIDDLKAVSSSFSFK